MSEADIVNVMAGLSGITIQARDINGGIHFTLAPDTAPKSVELATRTADLLAQVLPDIEQCLTVLGVPDEDITSTFEHVTGELLMKLHRGRDGLGSRSFEYPHRTARLATLINELLNFLEPERLLSMGFYVSTKKLASTFRAYRHRLDGELDENESRFLALHSYFASQHRLVFAPVSVLLGRSLPLDEDVWVFFSGTYVLRLSDEIFDRTPAAQGILSAPRSPDDINLVSTIFAATDPFYYPIVELDGKTGPHAVTMMMSRKYLELNSTTVSSLIHGLRGGPLTVTGFGTLSSDQPGISELRPIVLRAHPASTGEGT